MQRLLSVSLIVLGLILIASTLIVDTGNVEIDTGNGDVSETKPLSAELVGYTSTPDGWVALSGYVRGGVEPVTVEIDWGDGTVNDKWLHKYDEPGVYTVTLTASDATGATVTSSIKVKSHVTHSLSILGGLSFIPANMRFMIGVLMTVIGLYIYRRGKS